jgi:molecular chaperone GrpE (heat shock protein)
MKASWREIGYGKPDMPDSSPTEDPDFSAQMQALVIQAEQAREEKAQKSGEKRMVTDSTGTAPLPLMQMLRPLFQGMESLMRSQGTQSTTLERLEKALASHASVPEVLNDARQSLDQRNVINRAMFDALHSELKQYKDGFLLESVLRPVVRDIISLYDDAREIHRQVCSTIVELKNDPTSQPFVGFLENLSKNLEHHIHYVLEVLERMEVGVNPPLAGKLDKRAQRVIAREPAATEEEDLLVARSVRPGFSWRERLFRPEEVVVKKWGLSAETPHDGDVQDSPPA